MKKLLTLIATVIMLAVTSCGSADPAKVNEKILNGEELTQKDYKVMIDYLKAPLMKLKKSIDEGKIMNYGELWDDTEEIYEEYPYSQTFFSCLDVCYSNLDEANKKALDDLGKME